LSRIEQIRELAVENGVDVSEQIRQLETRALQLRQEIFSSLSSQRRNLLAILAAPVRSITFRRLVMNG